MARKKPVPKNPVGKKAQETLGGPGATYVPHQDSKQITQNCNRQKAELLIYKTITRVHWKMY